jgi:RNA polymerase sigma factor (sigma-70 family)
VIEKSVTESFGCNGKRYTAFSFIFKKAVLCSARRRRMSTTDYLSGILKGDPVVLRHMYRSLFPLIGKMVREQGGSEDDARDVFQEATVVIYSQAQSPDFSIRFQFNTYFTAVCRNLWLNRRTKKSASDVTIGEDVKLLADAPDPELDHLAVERRRLFDTAFLQLGEDCQRLLRLFFEKIPMNEIAERMGFASEGYARRRKFQCKDRLVELVKKQPQYLELIDE